MMCREISKRKRVLKGEVLLPASKSLCNRALIIGALGGGWPENVSKAKDSQILQGLLRQYLTGEEKALYHAGAGGTTYRFMLAFLATSPGQQQLTGSERMCQRPIGPLVTALRQMGAELEYLEREGYPPVRIGPFAPSAHRAEVRLAAHESSQYLSAVLLVAPRLPKGLLLCPQGAMVSRPYLDMTLGLMHRYGVEVKEKGGCFEVAAGQAYRLFRYRVEADWSAASYFYALAALSEEVDLFLPGLEKDSLQGDAVLAEWMRDWGVETRFEAGGVRLLRDSGVLAHPPLEMDFLEQPDLAQTFAVLAAVLGRPLRLKGLKTLRIKETDRLQALKQELAKVGVQVEIGGGDQPFLDVRGKAQWKEVPVFDTYEDHRMAMSLSLLSVLGPLRFRQAEVVEKSFPDFFEVWESC